MTSRIAAIRAAVTEGRGRLTTAVAVIPIDQSTLRSLLPSGLHVGDAPPTVLVMLSRNHFTSWFGDMRYLEMILGIPDVIAGDGVRRTYLRRLYLNQGLPRRLGNLIYGWEKLPATMCWDGLDETLDGTDAVAPLTSYRIRTPDGRPMLTAELSLDDPPATPAQSDIDEVDRVLAQPVLSQRARRVRADAATRGGGPFLTTTIDSAARTQPLSGTARLRIGDSFDPPTRRALDRSEHPFLLMDADQVVGLPRRVR